LAKGNLKGLTGTTEIAAVIWDLERSRGPLSQRLRMQSGAYGVPSCRIGYTMFVLYTPYYPLMNAFYLQNIATIAEGTGSTSCPALAVTLVLQLKEINRQKLSELATNRLNRNA